MDPFFGRPPPAWRVNNETGYAELVTSPRELFYHDLPEEEANYWISQLTSQSLKALFEGGEYTYAGWTDVPSCRAEYCPLQTFDMVQIWTADGIWPSPGQKYPVI
ncbi:hypothetical protein PoHVEF18_008161 [Penicillium ochrochloron]